MTMDWKVPLFDTDIGGDEIDAVTRVLRSGWLTMGEETKAFEREFASYVGVKHAYFVSNCTAALHMAHHALGAGEGDEVICPSMTFVATANSIIHTGAAPVFADVTGEEDFNISPDDILKKITPVTKGLAIVHYAGYPCDMDAILRIARERGLYVVEDCAHSPGASYKGRMTGSLGDIGCFSFFSNKNLSTGEGGMVTTDSDEVAEKLKLIRSHGMTTVTLDRHKGHAFTYDVLEYGFNYRSTEMNAALGRVQLGKLEAKNKRRQMLISIYGDKLKHIKWVRPVFSDFSLEAAPSYHIYPVLLERGVDREALMVFLKEKGVQTSIHYRPVHTFTAFSGKAKPCLPVLDGLMDRVVTLPLYPAMTEEQIEYIAGCLSAFALSREQDA